MVHWCVCLLVGVLLVAGCKVDEQPRESTVDAGAPDDEFVALEQVSAVSPSRFAGLPPTYATDLVSTSDCYADIDASSEGEAGPFGLPVAKEHAISGICDWVNIQPVIWQGFNMFDVPGEVLTDSFDPQVATVIHGFDQDSDVNDGMKSEYDIRPVLHQDIFDGPFNVEPSTEFTACIVNDCPVRPVSGFPVCEPFICAWFKAIGVVNLEGEWRLENVEGYGVNEPLIFHPIMNGRSFRDPQTGIKKGSVDNRQVRFDLDDIQFRGNLANRGFMSGTVWDLLNDEQVGTWFAKRMP